MIRTAYKPDASVIALLHQKTLTGSFLAKLGSGFLESLYTFLVKKELVLVYAEEDNVKGFVSFSVSSPGMMKRFLFSCPVCIFKLLGILVSSPSILKRLIETFTAPFKSKTSQSASGNIKLADAELFSISVDPGCQQSGIGSQRLKALEEELVKRGINKYKVIAGVSLDGANKFYNRNGFTMVSQVMIHGNELSNIYIKEI